MADNNSLTFLTDSGLQEYNNFLQNYLVEHFQEKGESDCRLEEIEITEIYNKDRNGLYCGVVGVQPNGGIVPSFGFEIVLQYIEDPETGEIRFNNIVSYSLPEVESAHEDLTLDSCFMATRNDLQVNITYNGRTYSYILKKFIKNVDTDSNEGSMNDGGRYHLSKIIAKTDKDSDYCEALLKAGKMPYIIFKEHGEDGEYYINTQSIFYPVAGEEMYYSEYLTKPQSLICFKLNIDSEKICELVLNYLIEAPHEEEQVEYIKRLTYDELKRLRDREELVPGMQYRIIAYECTTVMGSTQSANHQFDIIVTADSETTLNENARAIKHDGDSYFANSKLEAWQIKYCLDNDSERFAWADPNGYGVIYYMKDEFGNECPYDFKNILFLRKYADKVLCGPATHEVEYDDHKILGQKCLENSRLIANGSSWLYTFTDANGSDASLSFHYDPDDLGACYGAGSNVIGQCMNKGKMELANNVFCNVKVCYSNRFGNNATRNTFNTPTVIYNTFGNSIYDNNFASDKELNNNEISYNTFGNYIHMNTFGSYIQHNTFKTGTYFNVFGHTVLRNSFGNNFSYNTFKNGTYANTMLNDVFNNSFGDDIDSNMFGNQISGNTFGDKIYRNTIGNRNYDNTYGDCISQCTIDDCVNNNEFLSFIKALSVGSMVKYCKVFGGSDERRYLTYCQILSGTNTQTIAFSVGRVGLQVAGLSQDGTLKIWMPADLIQ